MQAGGSIDVDTAPGLGTALKIYFPIAAGSTDQSPACPDDADTAGRAETILVCEDEEEVRKLAVEVLQRAGYITMSASNGAAALAIATEYHRPIELLLTDVVMPGMDGRKLAELMTSARPGLRTLLMSGYPSDVIAHHGVLEEGVQFLQKPFTNRTFLKRIREVLDGQPCQRT